MKARQWQQIELELHLELPSADPYVDTEVWAEFVHVGGERLARPGFWDGGSVWRVRFASPLREGEWAWTAHQRTRDTEVQIGAGSLTAAPGDPRHPHAAIRHGFLRREPGGRALTYADGSSALLVADTAWAMPWRAQSGDVEVYARRRAEQGFNAVLLMTVQPDQRAVGPRGRNLDEGFAVGFEDLPTGHLNNLNVSYFQELDAIVSLLIEHGITPVLQPVFFGFGWKGLDVAGPVVPEQEYARYCRYLVARYGAGPVIYLIGADGAGTEPQIPAAGAEVERTDAYGQPAGIHYRPHAKNDAHQASHWLDFQWCQTGHEGDHVPERLAQMWRNEPPKPAMNAEPTYEHLGRPGNAAGWWQGHEAWSNLCAGGTMGVAYGAASLWQWRLHPNEAGHAPFFLAEGAGWREALEFEGARYVGLIGKILEGLPTTHLQPCWDVSLCTRGLLDPGVLYVGYAEHGGPTIFLDTEGRVPARYWLLDARSGTTIKSGIRPRHGDVIKHDGRSPTVIICYDGPPTPYLAAY